MKKENKYGALEPQDSNYVHSVLLSLVFIVAMGVNSILSLFNIQGACTMRPV